MGASRIALTLSGGLDSRLVLASLLGDNLAGAITYATRGDATGLLIVNEGVWGAGGYFYIGKNIPWGVCDFGNEGRFIGAVRDPRINRAVTFEDRAAPELLAAGFKEVHRIGREAVFAR
jgi:hypothetical protein